MSGRKIVIVEDDRDMAAALKTILELEGYGVTLVHDGPAAMEAHRTENPDLMILDVALPLMDGVTACKAIRKLDNRVLILMLTAQRAQVNTTMGLDAGADGYLVKPVGPQELVAWVKSLFRRLER